MDEDKDNEIVPEDIDDSVVEEEHAGERIKKLKEKLEIAEGKAKEYLDGWQRERAEIANARKRDEEARKEFIKFVSVEVVKDLIPVLDSLNLSGQDALPIYKQMMQILKLEESNPVGEIFDPRLHEAMGSVETPNKDDDHKILEVMQKGYILQGKIIRPAKVRIGEFNKK